MVAAWKLPSEICERAELGGAERAGAEVIFDDVEAGVEAVLPPGWGRRPGWSRGGGRRAVRERGGRSWLFLCAPRMRGSGGSAVAGPDGGESAVEMAFDGADGQAGDGGDVGNLEVFDEAEEEDLRWRLESSATVSQMRATCSLAMRRDSAELPRLGKWVATSATSTAVAAAFFQKRKRSVRVWSRRRLRAMRMSQVGMEQSSRKVARAVQARRKVSWVRVWAGSRSRREESRKRKMRGS